MPYSCGLVILALWSSLASSTDVVTWGGGIPEWNKKFAVTEIRSGCNIEPAICLQRLKLLAAQQGVARVTMAINGPADTVAKLALGYSEVSTHDPLLHGIGIDDFVRVYGQWLRSPGGDGPAQLERVIRNAKSVNHQLMFGITIYDDELDLPILREIPENLRTQIDRVSLYLHRRAAGPSYATIAHKAQALFPNSAILGGVYAYDRIDYVPCSDANANPCAPTEELALFQRTVAVQAELIRLGRLAGLEFYPGRFGNEAGWQGWSSDKVCRAARRAMCIAQTARLRDAAYAALSDVLGSTGR